MVDGKRSRLLCLPEGTVAGSGGKLQAGQVLAFAHPRGGKPVQFLLSPEGRLCELQSFQPSGTKYGSWFVEQRVVSDGKLYVATPMDPKFLLLPVLERHGARYSPLEQILAAAANAADGAGCRHVMALRRCPGLDLGKICDVNDQLGDDMILYRLNPAKALAWLAQKVDRTKRALVQLEMAREGQNSGIGSGFAAGFCPQPSSSSSSSSSVGKAAAGAAPVREATREQLRTAVEIVSDYLTDEWSKKLMEHVGFTEEEMKEAPVKKRAAWEASACEAEQDRAAELTQGKRKSGNGGSSNSGGNGTGGGNGGAKAGAGPSAAHKKLAKTNLKGVKSIASFFGKK